MTFSEVEKVLNDFCFINTGILSGTYKVFSNKRGEEIYVGKDVLEYTAYAKIFEYSSLTPSDLINYIETGN
jgi:hypothetical protein